MLESAIESADTWHDLRAVRNRLAHDYPSVPELLVAEVQQAVDAARAILSLWSVLKASIFAHPMLRTLTSGCPRSVRRWGSGFPGTSLVSLRKSPP